MSREAILIISSQIQQVHDVWQVEEADGPSDSVGPTYGLFRVAAGAYLAQEHPDAMVIASGFAPFEGAPSIARVVRDELIERGVAQERIRLLEEPTKTYKELQALQKLAEDVTETWIITNEWHVPRVNALLEKFPVPGAHTVAAEDILLAKDEAQWRERVERMRQDPRMTKRHAQEKQGIEDLQAGRYRFDK